MMSYFKLNLDALERPLRSCKEPHGIFSNGIMYFLVTSLTVHSVCSIEMIGNNVPRGPPAELLCHRTSDQPRSSWGSPWPLS